MLCFLGLVSLATSTICAAHAKVEFLNTGFKNAYEIMSKFDAFKELEAGMKVVFTKNEIDEAARKQAVKEKKNRKTEKDKTKPMSDKDKRAMFDSNPKNDMVVACICKDKLGRPNLYKKKGLINHQKKCSAFQLASLPSATTTPPQPLSSSSLSSLYAVSSSSMT